MSRVAPGLGIEVREGKGRTGGRGGRRRRNINLGGAEEGRHRGHQSLALSPASDFPLFSLFHGSSSRSSVSSPAAAAINVSAA